ncbi:MAG: hypothetical protein ABID61_01165, partial [Candidatus Micrarchaeota archaeon]
MVVFKREILSNSIIKHGKGGIGGKGDGLRDVDAIFAKECRPKCLAELPTHILADEMYIRYRNNGDELDCESREELRHIHASLGDKPISVRPSEEGENNPNLPTSGGNTSHMLPNCHPDQEVRFSQVVQAVTLSFNQFAARQDAGLTQNGGVAIVTSPIPGILSNTQAGKFYYPMSAGVADSVCAKIAHFKPGEGFGRVVFGHGYGAVQEIKAVRAIPILSISNPTDTSGLVTVQRHFYAINMDDRITELNFNEKGTLSLLTTRFAGPELQYFTGDSGRLNFGQLIGHDSFGYSTGLQQIFEALKSGGPQCFEIEFTFNIFDGQGVFHLVQYKLLRDVLSEKIDVPELQGLVEDPETWISRLNGRRVYLATDN